MYARFGTVSWGTFAAFDSSFGIDAGIELKLVKSLRAGDGSREFMALFVTSGESSRSGWGSSPPLIVGTAADELTIVLRRGLAGRSLISDAAEGCEVFEGMGICSIVSRDELPGVLIESGAGFLFLLGTSIESSDE